MTVDATIPVDSTLGTELASLIREERGEINDLWDAFVAGIWPAIANVQLGAGVGTLDADSRIPIAVTMATPPNTLTALTNGRSGQVVILRLPLTEVGVLTVQHNVVNIVLGNAVDFAMEAGDTLWLMNIGGVYGVAQGIWYEIHRSLYTAVHGIVSPDGTRYRIIVSNLGVLSAEAI